MRGWPASTGCSTRTSPDRAESSALSPRASRARTGPGRDAVQSARRAVRVGPHERPGQPLLARGLEHGPDRGQRPFVESREPGVGHQHQRQRAIRVGRTERTGERLPELGAEQPAGEPRTLRHARRTLSHHPRAEGEQLVQPACIGPGLERPGDARIEGGLVERRRIAEGLREAAVGPEQFVELAGEPGAEGIDHALAQPQPLRMRAWHAQQAVGQAGAQRLGLLAAQHVGLAGPQPADDRQHTPERGRHRDQPVPDRIDAGGQVDIGRFQPRPARTDHAAGEERRAGTRRGPVADRLGEHCIEAPRGQADRALVTGATIADGPVGIDQPGAQPRRAPVDRDHAVARTALRRLRPHPRSSSRRAGPMVTRTAMRTRRTAARREPARDASRRIAADRSLALTARRAAVSNRTMPDPTR